MKSLFIALLCAVCVVGAAQPPPHSPLANASASVVGEGSCGRTSVAILVVEWDGQKYVAMVIPEFPRTLLISQNKERIITVEGLGENELVKEYTYAAFTSLYPSPCDWLVITTM
jgi:hypothetical protein